jgi:hypothetical protein
MRVDGIIKRLEANAEVIAALVTGVGPTQARWRPGSGKWSIVEVLNHLADEEVEDFRTRIEFTLERPGEPWPTIDPVRWVVERAYQSRSLEDSLHRFLEHRRDSIVWLERLQNPDWTVGHTRPGGERLTAGDLLISWVAHDFIHIRQLNRLHREYLLYSSSSFRADYAGPW